VLVKLTYARARVQVWTFTLKDATLRLENETVGPVERIKIVACKSMTGDAGASTSK
jgi:hypothetical protein